MMLMSKMPSKVTLQTNAVLASQAPDTAYKNCRPADLHREKTPVKVYEHTCQLFGEL